MSDRPVPTPPGLPPVNSEVYLGDGLYVSFDGYCVWLRAPRQGGHHRVAFEPHVWQSLLGWLAEYPVLRQHMEGMMARRIMAQQKDPS